MWRVNRKNSLRRLALAAMTLGALSLVSATCFAQQTEDKTRDHYFEALKGKKIVWLAAVMGNDLQSAWDAELMAACAMKRARYKASSSIAIRNWRKPSLR